MTRSLDGPGHYVAERLAHPRRDEELARIGPLRARHRDDRTLHAAVQLGRVVHEALEVQVRSALHVDAGLAAGASFLLQAGLGFELRLCPLEFELGLPDTVAVDQQVDECAPWLDPFLDAVSGCHQVAERLLCPPDLSSHAQKLRPRAFQAEAIDGDGLRPDRGSTCVFDEEVREVFGCLTSLAIELPAREREACSNHEVGLAAEVAAQEDLILPLAALAIARAGIATELLGALPNRRLDAVQRLGRQPTRSVPLVEERNDERIPTQGLRIVEMPQQMLRSERSRVHYARCPLRSLAELG